jgi:hypothetical protein
VVAARTFDKTDVKFLIEISNTFTSHTDTINIYNLVYLWKKENNYGWNMDIRSRDNSVGIATGYGLDDQGEREFKSR